MRSTACRWNPQLTVKSSTRAPNSLTMTSVLTSGGRVLCATALGHTVAEAQQRAYALMTDIHWDGSFSRRDIGWRAIERQQN
ncbi:phosphoribosylglycinamide synthetase C domain-containing protein [Escherichia coli]